MTLDWWHPLWLLVTFYLMMGNLDNYLDEDHDHSDFLSGRFHSCAHLMLHTGIAHLICLPWEIM